MPYVPSKKTDGKSTDREEINAAVEQVAARVVCVCAGNFELLRRYEKVFLETAQKLNCLHHQLPLPDSMDPVTVLAETVYAVGAKYGYEGAFLGEFNYACTRLIQRVPQIMVAEGRWKESDELRYWLYACTVEALTASSALSRDCSIGVSGVLEDVKDEYKRRVNTAYEAAQILKSGDCYDTPYYTRLVPVVDEKTGKTLGHMEIMLKRSPETLGIDVMNGNLVFRSNT